MIGKPSSKLGKLAECAGFFLSSESGCEGNVGFSLNPAGFYHLL